MTLQKMPRFIIVKKSGGDYIVRVAGGAILHRCKSARAAIVKAWQEWGGTDWLILYIYSDGKKQLINQDYADKFL